MCATHSNALGHTETHSQIFSALKNLVKGHLIKLFVELVDELLSDSQQKQGSLVFLKFHLSCLKLYLSELRPGVQQHQFAQAANLGTKKFVRLY